MRQLERYGREGPDYEGLIHVAGGVDADGYFQAIQAPDSSIAIGCLFEGVVPLPDDLSDVPIDGFATNGWLLHPEGQILSLFHGFHNANGVATTEATISPARLRATRLPEEHRNYLHIRFAVANLLFGTGRAKPEPIEFEAAGRQILLTPIESYVDIAGRLQSLSGVATTVTVKISSSTGERHRVDQDAAFMDRLVSVLRLWSGTKTDWIRAEGLDDSGEQAVEILHKHGTVGTRPHSIASLGWRVDLSEFVRAFFADGDGVLPEREVRNLISYFVDAWAEGPYLEVRGLAAATLLDALTAKVAVSHNKQDAISEKQFNEDVLPLLRSAIDTTKLSEGVRGQLKSNAQGMFRASFRRRLNLLNTELDLGMTKSFSDRIIRSRDSLVHEGRFAAIRGMQNWDEYRSIVWTDWTALCRLIGYGLPLPSK